MITLAGRDVRLTAELQGFVDASLASGAYADADTLLQAALSALRDRAQDSVFADWPVGGGDCGALIRERDWSRTALGPSAGWSAELRAMISSVVNSPVPKMLLWGPEQILFYNDAYRAAVGDRHPSALGSPAGETSSELWGWAEPVVSTVLRGEALAFRDQPIELPGAEGTETRFFDLFYTPVFDRDGRPGGVLCTMVDNSARVAAERSLAASEQELRRITDAAPMLVSYIDRNHVYRLVNAGYEQWFGIPADALVGRSAREIIGEQVYARRVEALDRALAGEAVIAEEMLPHRSGTERRAELRYVPRIEPDGSIPGVYVLGIDIDDRSRREADLAASNARFRTAMRAIDGVLWTNSADGRMVGEQPGWGALTGQTQDEYQGFGWSNALFPDDVGPSIQAWNAAVAAKAPFIDEQRVRRHDGEWRIFAVRGLPILREDGEIAEWVGVHADITHRRNAEAALRAHAEDLARQVRHRQRAEEQLRQLNETLEARVIEEIAERREAEARLAQAQKLETVGKLTGGIAHDFNNLLQVIGGNLQLLTKDIAGNERAERRVGNAMAGVSRGSKLASQLLAFGRRQALEPKVVNVTRFVQGMDDMLRRAIGGGIEIETIFSGGLWNTFIDPTQIENALLNLAINARDAMNGQGKLTIELANAALDDAYASAHSEVSAGQYVMLAVTDTGSGMSPEIMARVFEPFFSTKPEGKGSGLGLSMVYGFVKQSGGHVKIYSEPGLGTTIRLYLPRAIQSEDVEVSVQTGPIAGGTETVLVVEDDEGVRDTVVEMLSDLGYSVLKAVDAGSALAVIESGVPIDMLFTDVVMPGTLKSPELARKARERLPDLAVLFTSGYTENSIVHGGRLDAGVELLSKPYTREQLARKFRHVLSNRKQRGLAAETAAVPAPIGPVAANAITVLLVEDDDLIRVNTVEMLSDAGYVVIEAGSAEQALNALHASPVDILVTDNNLPGASGLKLAEAMRTVRPDARIVFATGDPSAVATVPGARLLAKPYGSEALLRVVAEAGQDLRPILHGAAPTLSVG
ncbi:PAS domain-containing protein [Acetobacteraceae bacterium KSS8]|uniref:histidine kinase n=1 Tax=Endosaccharibacter trunci TaxID=2812733 RepID=A0ABT1WB14_9PROT|nr:PAS domain-containing protein [Acetobacteraceae bacterium KSS8]